ncbi:MAG: hypothetical protein ACR2GY_05075 [Phycisphaerales bacterium]
MRQSNLALAKAMQAKPTRPPPDTPQPLPFQVPPDEADRSEVSEIASGAALAMVGIEKRLRCVSITFHDEQKQTFYIQVAAVADFYAKFQSTVLDAVRIEWRCERRSARSGLMPDPWSRIVNTASSFSTTLRSGHDDLVECDRADRKAKSKWPLR